MADKQALVNVVSVINDNAPVTKATARDIAIRVFHTLGLEISASEFCYPVFDDPETYYCSSPGCQSWARKYAFIGRTWDEYWLSHYVERHL